MPQNVSHSVHTSFTRQTEERIPMKETNPSPHLLVSSHWTVNSEHCWLSFSRAAFCSCAPFLECLWNRRLANPSSLCSAVAVPVPWLQGTSLCPAIYTHQQLSQKQQRKHLKGAGQPSATKRYACVELPACSVC